MSSTEAKWKANQTKVAFLKKFPGLLQSWEKLAGHTVQSVTPLQSKPGGAVLVFTDGSFAVVPPLAPEPRDLKEGITVTRSTLESAHRDAYAEYDRLAHLDKEATRAARMENIFGAIQTNLGQIPELKDRIRSLVKEWQV